jgi:hypothetical protein
MRLSRAELELIETVRHWDATNFTLTIRVDKAGGMQVSQIMTATWSRRGQDLTLTPPGTTSLIRACGSPDGDALLAPLSLSDIEGSARRDRK